MCVQEGRGASGSGRGLSGIRDGLGRERENWGLQRWCVRETKEAPGTEPSVRVQQTAEHYVWNLDLLAF